MKVTNFLHLSRTKNLLRGIMFAPLLLLAACNESPATAGSGTDLDPETGLESDIVITLLGDNAITLTEGSTFSDPGAQAFDENNDELTINVSGEVNSLKPGVYVLTYSATDELGNEVSEERTVTVLDGTAPVISLNGNTTVTLFQGQAFIEEGASALDNVDGDVSANINISGEVDTNTAATYTLTYSVSDAAGNQASIERTVVVTNSHPPVVTLTGPAEITLDQDADYVDAGATATDVEDGVLPVTVTGSVDTGKPGLYTLVFSATDADNNSSQVERTIIVLDTQAPSLSLNGPAELSINQNSVYDELGATATDNADGEITLSISGSVDTLKPASYTLTYTATDAAGNSSQTQRVVNVLDITAPVISLNGDAVIELNEGEQFIDPGATATDAEDGTVAITLEGEVDSSTPATYYLTYRAEDKDGNAVTAVRTIKVLDITAPVITLTGQNTLNINQGEQFIEPGVSAVDNKDGDINVTTTGQVNADAVGSYTLTYSATDAAGNSASTTRTVEVLDVTAPVVQLNGEAFVTLNHPANYAEQGANATDAVDGEIDVVITGQLNAETIGTYTLTYSATDAAGNSASKTRTVTVVDVTAPIISLNGNEFLNLNQDVVYSELGASATDAADGDIDIVISGEVQTQTVGTYTLTYSATDASGNTASKTRRVNILDPNAPVISLNGSDTLNINQGSVYVEQGASAIDAVDGDIEVVITGQVNADVVGSYTLVYSATDSAGNRASIPRTVHVLDVTAPVISLIGEASITLNHPANYVEQGASASDAVNGDIDVVITGQVNAQTIGTYTLTYSATDAAGNISSQTRTVNIVDTTPPELTLNGAASIRINEGSVYSELGASSTDAVDGSINVVISGQVQSEVGVYTLTYNATDAAGNSATKTRRITVVDITPPVISLNGSETLNIDQGAAYSELNASATDAVDGDINVVITGQVNAQTIGTYTLTYSATDAAGNSATATRTVNVIDVTPPAVSLIGSAVMTTSHGQAFLDPGAQALDAVDGTLTISTSGTVNTQAVGTYTLTYSATDAAGNQASVERNVRVEDHTPPVISLSGSNPLTLKLGSEYLEPGSSAVDAVDGTVTVSASGTVNIQKVGSYSLTYSTVDAAGNQSQVSRVVEVMQRPFITTWQTDNGGVAAEHFIELPVEKVSVFRRVPDFNFTVDWGDGQTTDYSTEANINETTLKHVYDNAGSYQVSITGAFPSLNFSCANEENNKMLSVDQWGDIEWYSMEYGFQECNQRTITATDAPVFTPNASTFSMFHYATNFNDNIGHWDMTNVKSMSSMFTGASTFNQDIGQWNVSRADRLDGMFTRASSFNQNLNSWNVSGVYNFAAMFYEATEFNSPIGDWNVSSATNMDAMFYYAGKFDQDISQWDVSNVESFARMFNYAKAFNQDISLWKTSKVEDMYRTFYGAHSFNQNIANWDVSNVEDMRSTFSDATVFNQDISDWDVSKVKNMTGLFSGAKAFNQDIGGWDVSNVIQMTHMFSTSEQFNQDISSWNVSNVTNMNYMFSGATAFSQDLRDWNVANVTSMRGMFKDAAAFNNGYGVSLWDVSKVTNMVEMFSGVKLYFTGYDSILKNWSQLNLQRDVFFDAGNSQHSQNATVYKAILTENLGWSINDNDEIWIGPRP